TVRVDLRLADNTSLTKGKGITSTSYVFAFDDEFYSGGGLPGRKKDVHGDLNIKTDFFPMVYINHLFNERDVELFGGNVKNKNGVGTIEFIIQKNNHRTFFACE
ncbi:hypothetical protein ACTWOG_005255, partial [Serratia marcescens]